MTIIFPAIAPTTRSFDAAQYAELNPQYVGTISYPRLLASKPGKAKLSLSYENIADAQAASIIAVYMNTLSGYLPVALPPEVVAGIDDEALAQRIQTGLHMDWYFDSPPKQNSVKAGISTVQVELIADF